MKRIAKLRPAIAAFLMMIATATLSSLSFFNQPVATELRVGMGTFTLYYSLMVAAGALTAPFVGGFLQKFGIPKILLTIAVWGLAGMFLFSMSYTLWMFYAVGILMGLLCSSAVSLIANVILQTYYSASEAASMIGIVMAGSGVGSMLYSSVIPSLLENVGIAMSYRIVGVIWFAILFLAVLILGKPQSVVSEGGSSTGGEGMTRAEALRSPVLYMVVASVILLTFGSGLIQHFPTILAEKGYPASAAGAVISFYSAVLTVGKIAQGVLYGKAGIKKGSVVVYALYIAGFLFLLNAKLVYPAFFCIGIGFGILTTLTPVLSKALFGQKEYAGIYGIVSMGMSIGSFIATPVWGMVYDTTGSYDIGFMVMPVLLVIAFVLQMTAMRLREKTAK